MIMSKFCSPKQVRLAYESGKVRGYKKAIAFAKEWLFENGKLDKLDLVEFDIVMEKLWKDDTKERSTASCK